MSRSNLFVRCMAASLVLVANGCRAETPPASLVAFACKQEAGANPSQTSAALCTFLLKGFVDGFHGGANRGLRVAFIQDPQNLGTTRGVQDLNTRISSLRPKAQCVSGEVTVRELSNAFAEYVDAHPNQKSQPYHVPLVAMLEEKYCAM